MSKVGFHTIIGDRKGLGQALKQCASAGQPVRIIKCVDDMGPAQEAKNLSDDTITIGRLETGRDSQGNKHVLSGLDARAIAAGSFPDGTLDLNIVRQDVEWYYDIVRKQWDLNPQIDYWECFNEWSAHWEYQAQFYIAMMDRVERDKRRLALFGFSTGNPPKSAYPHIALATARAKQFGGHILSLHEYGGVGTDIKTLRGTEPYHALRYRTLWSWLKGQRSTLGTSSECDIAITETGQAGGFNFLGTEILLPDIAWYDAQMQGDSYVLGCAIFTLGNWYQSNYQDALPALTEHIINNPDQSVPPLPDIPDEPQVPYVVKVNLLPQDTIPIEALEVVRHVLHLRESIVFSADDAKRLVKPGQPGSFNRVWGDPDRWTGGYEGIESYLDTEVVFKQFAIASEPDPVPPPSDNWQGIRSLHWRADGGALREIDVQAFDQMHLDGAKLQTSDDKHTASVLSGMRVHSANILVRFFVPPGRWLESPQLDPERFIHEMRLPIQESWELGIRWFELLNEVNLKEEYPSGDPIAFTDWAVEVVTQLKNEWPEIKIITPGLSPGKANTELWWSVFDTRHLFGVCDGFGAHHYGATVSDLLNDAFREYLFLRLYLTGDKKIHLTEVSVNRATDDDVSKGQGYVDFWNSLEPEVARADLFVLSASNPIFEERRETIVRQDGTISDIARVIGER